MLLWIGGASGWWVHLPGLVQATAPVREIVSLSDAAVAFAGMMGWYLVRQSMAVKEKVTALESLPRAIERIETNIQKMAEVVQLQRLEIADTQRTANENRAQLDTCTFHHPQLMRGQRTHE